MSENKLCAGCGELGGFMDVALTMFDRAEGLEWHEEFCTPRCAYDWWRKMFAKDYGQHIEPDLLTVVAVDIFRILEGHQDLRQVDETTVNGIIECWERLGHVLGDLDLTVPEVNDE